MLVFEDLFSGQVQESVLIFELSYQNQIDALAWSADHGVGIVGRWFIECDAMPIQTVSCNVWHSPAAIRG